MLINLIVIILLPIHFGYAIPGQSNFNFGYASPLQKIPNEMGLLYLHMHSSSNAYATQS